jgi:trk system potassium uptake protein TrkA
MNTIVIVGAGDIGQHIATILSKEEHNIILIDQDRRRLEKATWNIDVATRHGSGTNWQLLEDLMEQNPSLIIALTSDDETNLVICSIAKQLGYPRTIARVRETSYLNRSRLDFSHIFDVDHFVGPELLVANEITKYILSPGSIATEHFAHGAVQLRTLEVPPKWSLYRVPLNKLELPEDVMVGLILRGGTEVIFPHGEDCLLPGDEVTFIGQTDAIVNLHEFFGLKPQVIESAVIVGGSTIGMNLAKILALREVDVRLIEKDYDKCVSLAEKLPHTTIMNHDATDFDFLQAEKVGLADILICCTGSDEVNIMAALLGKEVGCGNLVSVISNPSYVPMVHRLGVNHSVSPRQSVSDHILSQIFAGTVTSLVSLYENQAEVMEISVSDDAKIVGIPLSDLGPLLPKDVLIAMIQNRGRIMVANGNRIISPGDTVIVIANPKHVHEFEKIF